MTRRTRTESRDSSTGFASGGRMAVVHHLPTALPGLVVVAVLTFWAADQGGFFPEDWYPGALLILAVLAVTAFATAPRPAAAPAPLAVAIVALGAYTAWTYLSIIWADSQGAAWDGANRTLLYFLLFALFARVVTDARAAAVALGTWALAITVLAVVVLVELPGFVGEGSGRFADGLAQPLGYKNGNAALWLMAAWPALMLAACREVPAWLTGVFAGAVVVLAGTSLLSESRGTIIASGVCLLVALMVVPGRVRTLVALVPAGIAIAATAPWVLRLTDDATNDPSAVADLGSVAVPILLAAVAAGAVAAGLRLAVDRRTDARWARGERVAALAVAGVVIAALAGGIAAVGDPFDRLDREWTEFKETGARYDYFRVALDLFTENPVTGVGADNFAQDYRERGRVGERPISPHSLELRALAQTGFVGAILLLAGVLAAFVAAVGRMRSGPPLARAVGAGGALTALYWVVQGSGDWLWEFPALGGAAFAALGMAAAGRSRGEVRAPSRAATVTGIAGGVAIAAAAASLTLPWIAEIERGRAARVWVQNPDAAFRQLDLASDLNPLSERPGMEAGTIAIRLGRFERARRAFEEVVDRNPRNPYATLQLGAIASQQGRRREALRLLRRALELSPRDAVVLGAVEQARKGRVDVTSLTEQVFANSRAYVRSPE